MRICIGIKKRKLYKKGGFKMYETKSVQLKIALWLTLFLAFVSFVCAVDQTQTGFYYPTGTSDKKIINLYFGWLFNNCGQTQNSESEFYHIGTDIKAKEGDPVYAIAGGVVIYVDKSNAWSGSGQTYDKIGNGCVIVQHTLIDGSKFLAFYGHVKVTENKIDKIAAGSLVSSSVSFAKIGSYIDSSQKECPHLHFGVIPNASSIDDIDHRNNLGHIPCHMYPDVNKFVDPIKFIETQYPYDTSESPTHLKLLRFFGYRVDAAGKNTYSIPSTGPWPIAVGEKLALACRIVNTGGFPCYIHGMVMEIQDPCGKPLSYMTMYYNCNAETRFNLNVGEERRFPQKESEMTTYPFYGLPDGNYYVVLRVFPDSFDVSKSHIIGRQMIKVSGALASGEIPNKPIHDLVLIPAPTDKIVDPPIVTRIPPVAATSCQYSGSFNTEFWGYANRCDYYNRTVPGDTLCFSIGTLYNGTPPYTYQWCFGDGSPYAYGKQVTHRYTQVGIYDAWCLFTDSKGKRNKMGIGAYIEYPGSGGYAKITVQTGNNYAISPETVNVPYGLNKTFSITPKSGYLITDVMVDNIAYGSQSTFTFAGVRANHTISAIANLDMNDLRNYDHDSDGYTELQGDCDDSNQFVHPGIGLCSVQLTEQALCPGELNVGDLFGYQMAINNSYLAITAYGYSEYSGTVYMYRRGTAKRWSACDQLLPRDGQRVARFGCSLALSDNNRLAIGADNSINGGICTGSVYVYEMIAGRWTQKAKIVPADGKPNDYFGTSVSISSNGNTLAIGAQCADGMRADVGAIYVFTRNADGTWTQRQKIVPSSTTAYHFGSGIKMIKSHVFVYSDENDFSGQVYIFPLNSRGFLQAGGTLAPKEIESGDHFGQSLTISGDYLMVTASGDDDLYQDAGALYIFRTDGGNWHLSQKVSANGSKAKDQLNRVSMFGNYAIATAPMHTEQGVIRSGAAYLWELKDDVWAQEATLVPNISLADDSVGMPLLLDKDIIIGICQRNSNRGIVYTYQIGSDQ
ncbi:MAG: peptidoglycan DD-metalloendopeptidase family protein [Patescibacteria group bacterium]|nr:peptidoglycan DD-metalloendopeptidase family protein [Patescibacteria group bacterium]